MDKIRLLLRCLFKLCVAVVCVVAAIAAYRFLLHPVLESALSLDEHASSMVRRANIFLAMVLSYWAFVRYYERRAVRELSLRWRWTALAAVARARNRWNRCHPFQGKLTLILAELLSYLPAADACRHLGALV